MARLADPLRKLADRHADRLAECVLGDDAGPMSGQNMWHYLYAIANEVDADHERRMEQCRRETKRAALRYLRSVMEDYCKHDMKRSRDDMLARYERKGRKR